MLATSQNSFQGSRSGPVVQCPVLVELPSTHTYTARMPENRRGTREGKDEFASANRELEQLVHLISSKFNGDTLAFFNSLDPKPPVREDSVPEYELVRNFLARSS